MVGRVGKGLLDAGEGGGVAISSTCADAGRGEVGGGEVGVNVVLEGVLLELLLERVLVLGGLLRDCKWEEVGRRGRLAEVRKEG